MFLKVIYLDQHTLSGRFHAYKLDVLGMFIKQNGIIDIYLINSGCTEAVAIDSGVVLHSFLSPPHFGPDGTDFLFFCRATKKLTTWVLMKCL